MPSFSDTSPESSVTRSIARQTPLWRNTLALLLDHLTFIHIALVAFSDGTLSLFFTLADQATILRIAPVPSTALTNNAKNSIVEQSEEDPHTLANQPTSTSIGEYMLRR